MRKLSANRAPTGQLSIAQGKGTNVPSPWVLPEVKLSAP